MSASVIKPGLLSSLQDGGRPGYARLGIGRAGAMDRPAWRLANALVGNGNNAAAIECTLVGPTLRFAEAATIALTGASMAASVNGHPLPMWTRCRLPAGSVLELGGMRTGCRAYVAVAGGFDTPPILGSRSTDLHARIGWQGGRALRAGDMLAIGPIAETSTAKVATLEIERWGLDPQPWFDFAEKPLALLPGSHMGRLSAVTRERLFGDGWRISTDSNRTASRLDGQVLELSLPLELISEATVPGTIQLPPSGQPIVLMAEAPVTGGYPRIAQVAAVDLPRLAQRRPGDRVRFHPATLDEALQRLRVEHIALDRLLATIAERLEHPQRLSPLPGRP